MPLGLLAASAFLSQAGARVVDPLLSVIADDFATTIPAVSIVIAAYTLPYGLCQVFLGPIGDRLGKLRVILVALAAYAVATAACALATGLLSLTVLRVMAGLASAALIPVGIAYIADAVPYAERQVTLSKFLNGSVMALALSGPLGGVFGEYVGWRGVFLLLAATAVVPWVLLARQIGMLPDKRNPQGGFSVATYTALLGHSGARALLVCGMVDGMLLIGCFPFLAPYMRAAFGMSFAAIGLVLACFGLGALVYTRLAHRLVPRLGEARLVLVGGGLMAGALLVGILSPWSWVFVPVEGALGVGFYLLHGVMQARASEMLPQARATAVSSFAFMLFLGQSLGALVMGALIARLGYREAFLVDAVGIIVFGVVLFRIFRRKAMIQGCN